MMMPMSSYSLSLRLLEMSGYWDADVIADEWHMFVKAFFARNGEVKVERDASGKIIRTAQLSVAVFPVLMPP